MTSISKSWHWAAGLSVLAIVALLPIVYPHKYVLHVASLAMILGIAALALQLLLGFTGLLSLGQAAFFGIGAYTAGILTTSAGLPFELGFVAAGFVSGASALLLVPVTRLRGVYLAVATLGFTIMVHLVLLNEEWLTGGSLGLSGIPSASVGPFGVDSEAGFYWLCLVVLVLTFLALRRLVRGRFGRALQAVKLDEQAATASGINVRVYKSQALVAAATITGLAGSLFAHHNQYLNPNDFSLWTSVEILVMVSVGGLGSLPGAVLGAFFITLLPEVLRPIEQFRMIVFGSLLIIFIGLGQGGLAGLLTLCGRSLVRLVGLTTASARSGNVNGATAS